MLFGVSIMIPLLLSPHSAVGFSSSLQKPARGARLASSCLSPGSAGGIAGTFWKPPARRLGRQRHGRSLGKGLPPVGHRSQLPTLDEREILPGFIANCARGGARREEAGKGCPPSLGTSRFTVGRDRLHAPRPPRRSHQARSSLCPAEGRRQGRAAEREAGGEGPAPERGRPSRARAAVTGRYRQGWRGRRRRSVSILRPAWGRRGAGTACEESRAGPGLPAVLSPGR